MLGPVAVLKVISWVGLMILPKLSGESAVRHSESEPVYWLGNGLTCIGQIVSYPFLAALLLTLVWG